MSSEWYVLRSKPHKEMALWKLAQSWSLDVYFPLTRVEPVNPRSKRWRAYFPGYLFARADLDRTGSSVFNHMPMSLGLVEFGGQPASVQSGVIERIRRHVDSVNRGSTGTKHRFEQGERVIITRGVLEGYEALFDSELPGEARVRVLLAMLSGQRLKATVPVEDIEAVSES